MMSEHPQDWYRRWLLMGPEQRGHMRTDTLRERRLADGEVDIDFVLHPPNAGQTVGPAHGWAQRAVVAEPMVLCWALTWTPVRARASSSGRGLRAGCC